MFISVLFAPKDPQTPLDFKMQWFFLIQAQINFGSLIINVQSAPILNPYALKFLNLIRG